MSTPEAAYHRALAAGFEYDPAQAAAVAELTRLQRALLATPAPAPAPGLAARLLRLGRRAPPAPVAAVPGLYLWGGVGRGKTWLMDLFFDSLPATGLGKQRLHFHRFMQLIHADLTRLRGQPDPLARIAAEQAARAPVLCLDEMQVNDITDAMLMAGLLAGLFAHGVTLVTTSNLPPHGLYRAGLQRDRFLPAIALLEHHCRVLELASPTDYRLRRLEQAPVYLTPLGVAADTALARVFADSTRAAHRCTDPVLINGRAIPVIAWGDGLVWFDFDVICHIPRSKLDYVELARGFHTVVISNLRRLGDEQANLAARLITLVDALYDCNCKLIASAEAPPPDLYRGRDLRFEFQRTVSRLIEMQSHAYLTRAHLA
ncbi:MAG: AFG1 family ATPase [Chromatiaceae bacterium]|nr:MAG: AFG1 family ATPase [Chromatiaceae bacterium]